MTITSRQTRRYVVGLCRFGKCLKIVTAYGFLYYFFYIININPARSIYYKSFFFIPGPNILTALPNLAIIYTRSRKATHGNNIRWLSLAITYKIVSILSMKIVIVWSTHKSKELLQIVVRTVTKLTRQASDSWHKKYAKEILTSEKWRVNPVHCLDFLV